MNDVELSQSELLKRLNDLKKVGFTVVLEANEKGILLTITKEKTKIESLRLYIKKFFHL